MNPLRNAQPILGLVTAGLLGTFGCAADVDDGEQTTALSGVVHDWSDAPVVDAEVVLVIGDVPITEPARTDRDGRYTLTGVPVEDVIGAHLHGDEVSVLIYSPREDLPPYGTVEGDRIRLTPLSLAEFVRDMSLLAVSDTVELRTGYVPLQAPGHAITDELIADGGELTWSFPTSPIGGALEITLIVEPGSIQLPAGEPQREITLTPIDVLRAPMQIPAGGAGVIWTIQPRDLVFDPPARVRVKGDRLALLGLSTPDVGTIFDVFGASLEAGWQRFGPVEVTALVDNRVTLESPHGIISRGAWGHVFAGTFTDAGTLITCYDDASGAPIPCLILDDNEDKDGDGADEQNGWIALNQWDYSNLHREVYYTDIEPVCAGCSNIGAPQAQLAFGLNLCGKIEGCDPNAPAPIAGTYEEGSVVRDVRLRAARLDCLGLDQLSTAAERDAVLATLIDPEQPPTLRYMGLYDVTSTSEVAFGVAPRNFSYESKFYLSPCPAD